MRSPSADYLEAAGVEKLVDDLRGEGYRVKQGARIEDQTFDLLAERGEERLVFEVKARSRLRESVDEIARLRATAREAGVTEFRLVVVNPPREVEATIEGLDAELFGYFLEAGTPAALARLSSATRVDGVTDVEIEAVDLRRSGIHVRGRATVEVEFNDGEGAERDGATSDSFPLRFDVELGPDLKLLRVNGMEIDTSAFHAVG